MPISVSQTILWHVSLFFILQKYRVWLHVQSQWQKLEWLSLGTPLKVPIAFWGVFSGFGHIAGNIYFALLPVEEDTAALHVLILHRHCAAHLAAPAQSNSPNLLWCKADTDGTLVSHTYTFWLLEIYTPNMCKNLISSAQTSKMQSCLKRTAAMSSGPQLFRLKKKIHWCVCIYTVSFKDSV